MQNALRFLLLSLELAFESTGCCNGRIPKPNQGFSLLTLILRRKAKSWPRVKGQTREGAGYLIIAEIKTCVASCHTMASRAVLSGPGIA